MRKRLFGLTWGAAVATALMLGCEMPQPVSDGSVDVSNDLVSDGPPDSAELVDVAMDGGTDSGADGGVESGVDVTADAGVPIGGACTSNADCTNGTNPTCVRHRGATTGMCSANCQTSADCESGNVCLFAPQNGDTTPGACARACSAASDCSEGLGCWVSIGEIACWPTDGIAAYGAPVTLDCDPTVAGCTFPGSSIPGGCERQVLGSGATGTCRRGCLPGADACPALGTPPVTTPQGCFFVDETRDSTGAPNGDRLFQTICVPAFPMFADGAECRDASGGHYFNSCAVGSQCFIQATAGGTAPDQICHRLCSLNPTGSADGGTSPVGCADGELCEDVFGLGSMPTPPTQPVGLCRPCGTPGFADCDGDRTNGCETDLHSLTNCGACGAACVAPPGATVSCDTGHCDLTCPSGNPVCVGGTVCCTPPVGGTVSCEVDRCVGACPSGTPMCAGGSVCCLAPAGGMGVCNVDHCETYCPPGSVLCESGAVCCQPPTNGTTVCLSDHCQPTCLGADTYCPATNACVHLLTDPNNCGGCGVHCSTGCTNGACS